MEAELVLNVVYLAVAALLAPALAEIAKIRAKAGRAFTFIAVGGILFIGSVAVSVSPLGMMQQSLADSLASLFSIGGLIVVLIGVLLATAALIRE